MTKTQIEDRQNNEMIRHAAEMLSKRMESRQREQHPFTVPPPGKCKDYGSEYEYEGEDRSLSILEKILCSAAAIIVISLLLAHCGVVE